MQGYHGTTCQNAKAILSSRHINVNKFDITGDWVLAKGQRLPNDLGQGFYLFLDDVERGFEGLENSKNYARRFKNKPSRTISVLKFGIDEDNLKVLKLYDERSIKFFNQYKKQYHARLQPKLKSLRNDGAFKRYNLDGIFLEHLLQYHKKFSKINAVTNYTFTPSTKDKPISSVPNGRELCLRDTKLLNWDDTEEVYNGL